MNRKKKPDFTNQLSDVVVEIPKTDIITPQHIINSFLRKKSFEIIPRIIFGVFFIGFAIVFSLFNVFSDDIAFRFSNVIPPLSSLLVGVSLICFSVSLIIKTVRIKAHILNGDYLIKRVKIIDVKSKYDSSDSWYDHYFKVSHLPNCWIKSPEVYLSKGKPCYVLYLPKEGAAKPFLIYIGNCSFVKAK